MNELVLSNDLNIITAEINSYKQVAGQAIFEIGRRLKHVKEYDLVHGEWLKWLESIEMDRRRASEFIKVYEEFGEGNVRSFGHLGLKALYEIATLPPEEREKAHTLSSGETKTVDEMTVRELKEVKKALKKKDEQVQCLERQLKAERNKQPEVIEKVVVKESIPENINNQLQEKDRFLQIAKKEVQSLQEELRLMKLSQNDELDDELDQKKLKRLEREASIETLELAVNIRRFLKDASLTPFQVGALASASDSAKKKMQENVELLSNFVDSVKTALNGRIKI